MDGESINEDDLMSESTMASTSSATPDLILLHLVILYGPYRI